MRSHRSDGRIRELLVLGRSAGLLAGLARPVYRSGRSGLRSSVIADLSRLLALFVRCKPAICRRSAKDSRMRPSPVFPEGKLRPVEGRRPQFRAQTHRQAFWGPKGQFRAPLGLFRRQVALRAAATRRPGKRCPGAPLASCVALAEAYELPVTLPPPGARQTCSGWTAGSH